METFLPDWSSGENGHLSMRSGINPIAALCRNCSPARKRQGRPANGLDRQSIGDIKQRQMSVPAGTDITTEGERGGGVYTVCEGWAFRYWRLRSGARQILDVLVPGDTAGLGGALLGASRSSVQALTSATICMLNGRQLTGLIKSNPSFALGVLRMQLQEERRIDARLVMLGRMGAEERVAYFMVETHDRLRRCGLANTTSCPFPLRRADLADVVGLSKVHVMRALRELRSQELVEINGRELFIPDIVRLADHAGYLLA
jgi:CRP/FNR family transcriptional regulator, anaerobic regulatory protein